MNKRGQVAIWVIVAIVIIGLILVLFSINRESIIPSSEELEVNSFVSKCVKESVNEASELMLSQGGFVEPANYKMYKYTKIEYLCENTGYFKPCINQHPLLLKEMQKEIFDFTQPKIEQCFTTLTAELEDRGYTVDQSALALGVEIGPGSVYANINKSISVTKNEKTQSYNDFKIEVNNPMYELANVAINIANEEALYCYTEYVGYMLLYPRYDIEKFTMSESTKIYTIKDKYSQKEMNIAIRGCAIPPGL